jgi:hypothetical protein
MWTYFKELGYEGTEGIHPVYDRYQLKDIVDSPDSVEGIRFLDKTESLYLLRNNSCL